MPKPDKDDFDSHVTFMKERQAEGWGPNADSHDWYLFFYRAGVGDAEHYAAKNPVPAHTPTVRELLTTDQRDALVTAKALLATMAALYEPNTEASGAIHMVRRIIHDMLYEP